ncbi:MAG TPA: response regulator [Leptolyngbyaceae cyanobacterium]
MDIQIFGNVYLLSLPNNLRSKNSSFFLRGAEKIVALVLIIEDAALLRKMVQRILKPEGYRLLEAENGVKGLEMIRTHKPDCILLDLLMPEMDGRQVLKALQTEALKVPTIVLTADIQESTRQECLELGALTVLNKLPKPEELSYWVKKAIGISTQESIYESNI